MTFGQLYPFYRKGRYMSWFKRKPRLKEPQKIPLHRNSPTTEKLMKATQEKVKPNIEDQNQTIKTYK